MMECTGPRWKSPLSCRVMAAQAPATGPGARRSAVSTDFRDVVCHAGSI